MEGTSVEAQPASTPATCPTSTEAAAFVLSKVLAVEGLTQEQALAGLQARLAAHKDPLSPAALAELRQQLPILDSLFHRFVMEALRATRPDNRALLLRAALQAQQAYSRTYALVHGCVFRAIPDTVPL